MTNDPIKKFSEWFDEAEKSPDISDHTEMCLATADKNGKPSARILLLKKFDEKGFYFFTNYNGKKSQDLSENPNAAICIYWDNLGKQIRIEGKVKKISASESDEYFMSRPRESRIGAWASKQSTELKNREEFLAALDDVRKRFEGKEVTRPENWGGWLLEPDMIEFWKAEEFRFHHRDHYTKDNNGNWSKKLLYP